MHFKPVTSSSPTHQRIGAIKSASVLRLQKAISRAHANVTAVPHARRASHPEYPLERTCSLLASKIWFTLQKPEARSGMPSCAIWKAPQLPAPDNTGERMAVRLSWPLFRLIHVPGTRASASLI